MSTLTKEQIKQLVRENNFQSVSDINEYLKDIFKDIIQELLEAELEAKLGYAKDDVENKKTDNSRNGYTPKKIKSEFGEIDIQVPRDRKGEFQPKIIPKYQRNVSGIEEKVIALYARGMSTKGYQSNKLKNFMVLAYQQRWLVRITDRIASRD
ncbi:transposase [Acetivibrio clariflavus]|uniref:transposase n=1 Tax=Acetivibrio clariflavus TaxID=288965 RepID=UPI0004BA9C6B